MLIHYRFKLKSDIREDGKQGRLIGNLIVTGLN